VTDSAGSSGQNQPWLVRARERALLYTGPVILLVFGLFLGLYDLLRGTEASGLLQVPALIAALILSADAITRLDAIRPASDPVLVAEAAPPAPADEPARPGRAYYRLRPTGRTVAGAPPPAVPATRAPALAYGVLVLSIWLGIASLGSSTATSTMQLSSFLAAVLLFYRGWTVVVPKRS
jgi:hypothetical protein